MCKVRGRCKQVKKFDNFQIVAKCMKKTMQVGAANGFCRVPREGFPKRCL